MNNIKAVEINEEKAKSIAKNLRTLLKDRSVSEGEISRALNTSIMTIRRILSGETTDPRISTLKLIADYFDVTIDSLLEDNNGKSICKMYKTNPQFVPILDWNIIETTDSIKNLDLKEWKNWYPIVGNINFIDGCVFALQSRPSMQPRFPFGTLFIIDQNESPRDGDVILIKMKLEKVLSLRELIIDSPKWQLQPIVSGSENLFFDSKNHSIIGVVVLTVLHTRD